MRNKTSRSALTITLGAVAAAAVFGQVFYWLGGDQLGVHPLMLMSTVTTASILAPVLSTFWMRRVSQLTMSRDELEHLAWTDHLTGLPNRRAFFKCADLAFAERARSDKALLMIDLDDFKAINDTAGHEAGDAALTTVANTIRQVIRVATNGEGLVARIGGEEFAVLVRRMLSDEVIALANQICAAVRQSTTTCEGQHIRTTVSVGIGFCLPDTTTDAALRVADEALYFAKNKGRDCCHALAQGGSRRLETISRSHGPVRGPFRAA